MQLLKSIIKRCYRSILWLFDKNIRDEIEEKKKVSQLLAFPRYTDGATRLFGKEIKFCDAQSYLFQVSEIFNEKVYDFEPESDTPYIIDAGANIGLSTLFFKQKFPDSTVLAFEPDPHVLLILKENLKAFDIHGVEIHEVALSDKEGHIFFSSDHADGGHISGSESSQKVKVDRLSKYIDGKIDFLKLDIEGEELRVLQDIESQLRNIREIFIEYHSYADQEQQLDKVLSILSRNNFIYSLFNQNKNRRKFMSNLSNPDKSLIDTVCIIAVNKSDLE